MPLSAVCPPSHATVGTVVVVESIEHVAQGAVIGDGHLVAVPFATTEVDRPGTPDAIVIDGAGARHVAALVATDAEHTVALVRTEAALGKPFAIAGGSTASGCILSPSGKVAPFEPKRDFREGTVVFDAEGRLVGQVAGGLSERVVPSSRIASLLDDLHRRPAAVRRDRRSVIFYGGVAITGTFATAGGFWFGGNATIAMRYRDTTELRVDAGVGYLLPKPSTPDTCGEPPCFEGIRGMVVPTIGPRIALGGHDASVVLTPFVGWAFAAQWVSSDTRTPAFDAEAPSTWSTFASGAGLSLGPVELRTKILVPRGVIRQSTIEIAWGAVF